MPLVMTPPKAVRRPAPEKAPALPDPAAGVARVVVGQSGRTYAEALRRSCLEAFPPAAVVTARSGTEILAALYAQRADFLLLAMNLPDMHGVDLLRRITGEKLAARVLVVCQHCDERTLLDLRNAQFDGLLDTEEESLDDLIRVMRLVAGGQAYVSPAFRGTVVDRGPVGAVWHKLTPAELRVFSAIGDGSGNQEATAQLGLSEATVQTHRRNLMHKLGISSSAKLVREAIRLGLVRISANGSVIRPGFLPAMASREFPVDRRSELQCHGAT